MYFAPKRSVGHAHSAMTSFITLHHTCCVPLEHPTQLFCSKLFLALPQSSSYDSHPVLV